MRVRFIFMDKTCYSKLTILGKIAFYLKDENDDEDGLYERVATGTSK